MYSYNLGFIQNEAEVLEGRDLPPLLPPFLPFFLPSWLHCFLITLITFYNLMSFDTKVDVYEQPFELGLVDK